MTTKNKPSEQEIAIARVYAQAALSLAEQQGQSDEIREELAVLSGLMDRDPAFESFLAEMASATGPTFAYLQILDGSLSKPPVVLDQVIAEGPAVSRTRMKIAFTEKQDRIWTADLVYEDGVPRLENRKLVIDNADVVVDGIKYEGMVEPQSFRPPEEKELIWAQYGHTEDGVFCID